MNRLIRGLGTMRDWCRGSKGVRRCARARLLLAGYLDGALPEAVKPQERAELNQHLEECAACREELERYRELSVLMSSTTPPKPPGDLGVSIRLAIAEARASAGLAGRLRRWKNRAELVLGNVLEPLALPAGAGVLTALLVFVMVYQVIGSGMPIADLVSDSPSNLFQPARLEVLAGFPMPTLEEITGTGNQHPLLVEATVDAQGEAISYRVITGRVSPSARRELDQLLLFSRFRPEMSFGHPNAEGHIVLSFSQIRVRG